jgi:hypothetical protein
MKGIIAVLVLSMLIVFTGCSKDSAQEDTALVVVSMSSGIGGIEGEKDSFERQRFSYELTLYNGEAEEVYVSWVEPILGEEFQKKTESNDNKITINKLIQSKQALNIKGEIIFNTKGLTKEEIMKLEPFVKDVKVSTEKILKLKWNNK